MSILTAELRILGSDKTGAAFAGVIAHARELQKTLAGMTGMGAADPKLAAMNSQLRQGTAALRSQNLAWREINRSIALGNSEITQRVGLMGRIKGTFAGLAGASGMGWMMGGLASGRVARSIAQDTSEYAHQKAMLTTTTGMSAAEVKHAVETAMALRVPTISAADNLRAIGELRMVFGSTEEAIKNVASVQRAAAIMKAVNPEKNAEAEAYDLARSLELKGVSMDPAHFNKLTSSMVQAINASRGKVSGEDFLHATRIAGSGTIRTWSDDFYSKVFPTLIQEMTPAAAGRSMTTFRRQLVGGHMQLQSASEWMRLGLLDRSKVKLDKIGQVKKIQPGALVGSDLFSVDPYAWVQKYLSPALQRKGITTDTAIAKELATLFSDRYAENAATILLTQKQRIEKDWGLIAQSPGLEAIDPLRVSDPKVAIRDLSASVNSLASSFGDPLTKHAITVMNGLADAGRYLASAYARLKETNPGRAEAISVGGALGLGYVGIKGVQATFGLLTGATALKGSAVALDASAGALNAAAARLGVGGVAGGAAGAAGVGAGLAGEAATGAALWRLSNLIPWIAGAVSIATTQDIMKTAPGGRDWVDIWGDRVGRRDELRPENNRPFTLRDIYNLGPDMLTLPPHIGGIGSDTVSALRDAIPALRDAIRGGPDMLTLPPHIGGIGSDTVSALRDAIRGGEPPKAELTGSAEITNTLTVAPSPDFITRIETMISNAIKNVSINGQAPARGSTGSTGQSMPEAAPTGGAW